MYLKTLKAFIIGMSALVKKLFLSTSKIVGDYKPLIEYLSLLDKEERERVIPSSKDFELIEGLGRELSKGNLQEFMEKLMNVKEPLIKEDIAMRAVEKAWKIRVDKEVAVREISKELAGWALEIAERLNIVKIKPGK